MTDRVVGYLRRHHVALLALFIALGGTSYGVATSSIDSREIKNNTVRSKDIRNNQVLSSDVRNGSLLARDFKDGQLPAGHLTGQVPQNQMPVSDGGALLELAPSGLSAHTGFADRTMLSPNRTIVLRDLAVRLRAAPGAGASRKFVVGVWRSGQLPSPAISCTTGANDTECVSTGTATIPPRSILTLAVANAVGNAPAAADARFGYAATIP